MKSIPDFIAKLPQPQRDIASALRKIIKDAAPDVEERLSWGMPWYFHNGMLCSIMPCKAYVNFLFPKGKFLADPKHILEGSGKRMRHVKIHTARDIRAAQFRRWVKQAVALNAPPQSGSTSSKRRRG